MNELETLPKAEAERFARWLMKEAKKHAKKADVKERFEKWLRRREELH